MLSACTSCAGTPAGPGTVVESQPDAWTLNITEVTGPPEEHLGYTPTVAAAWEWQPATSEEVRLQGEIALDGDRLYVATARLDPEASWRWTPPHSVHALDARTGALRWTQPSEGPLIQSVVADAVRHDVLIASNLVVPPNGAVRRYSTDGDLVSRFTIPPANPGSPGGTDARSIISQVALAKDSSAYFIAGSALLAIDWAGQPLWSAPLGDSRGAGASVAVTPDRVIAYAAGEVSFHNRSTGSLIASHEVGSTRPCTVRILSTGDVLVAQDGVRVFDSNGSSLWQKSFASNVCPVESSTGELVYLTEGGGNFGESTAGWFNALSERSAPVPSFVSPSRHVVALEGARFAAWFWPESEDTTYGGVHQVIVLDGTGAVDRRERLPAPRRGDLQPVLAAGRMIYSAGERLVAAELDVGPVSQGRWFAGSANFANTRALD